MSKKPSLATFPLIIVTMHSSYACTLVHCLTLYSTVPHCHSLFSTVKQCPALSCTVLHCPALSCTDLPPQFGTDSGVWTALYKFTGWDVAECGWDVAECGWDVAEWLERLTAYAEAATVLGSIPGSSGPVESEGRQMKQCGIKYIQKNIQNNTPV